MKVKAKRIICILAACVISVSAMAACGDSEAEDTQTETKQQQQQDTRTAAEVADELRNGIEYVDELNTLSADMIEKIYGVSADKYTSAQVYVGGVSTAEEIACFDAADSAAADEIKAACEDRIAAQIKSVESYNPAELEKLNDPVLVVKDNSVYMCLSNDNASARSIIG